MYKLNCIVPTKTIKRGMTTGIPIRQNWDDMWVACPLQNCSAFKVKDKNGINRIVSKKRFIVYPQ